MLLRGIAFSETRRNFARRILKDRRKTQTNERDITREGFLPLWILATYTRRTMMVYENTTIYPNFSDNFRKLRKNIKVTC